MIIPAILFGVLFFTYLWMENEGTDRLFVSCLGFIVIGILWIALIGLGLLILSDHDQSTKKIGEGMILIALLPVFYFGGKELVRDAKEKAHNR